MEAVWQFTERSLSFPLWGTERIGGSMKKTLRMIFLLTVCALLIAGCGKQKTGTNVEIESTVETGEVQEGIVPEETPEPETEKEEEAKQQEETELETETSKLEESTRTQNEDNAQLPQTEQRAEASTTPENTQQEETQPKPEQTEPVSYSPQRVVELAVEKTKAQGKIYIPDDLAQMLAAGEISQEDYDACYPTDGAGYLEYYVAVDMNEARDISGTVQFSSEADIAANIAGMYGTLPQQYFYIEYHGTVMYGGKECYVFYCYRA